MGILTNIHAAEAEIDKLAERGSKKYLISGIRRGITERRE